MFFMCFQIASPLEVAFVFTNDGLLFVGLLKDIPSTEAERLLSAVPIHEADLQLVRFIVTIASFRGSSHYIIWPKCH